MNLPKEDADLFFKLMWSLQFYVNVQRHILPRIKSVDEYAGLPSTKKVKVRDALWANPGMIEAYLEDNPNRLPAEELDIVRKWKQFVAGAFQIYRLLKKHAIFIGADSKVYGVLGLYDSLEEMFYGRPLPIMVEAVLLPFKGRIVYDGLFKGYNVYFGGGIRADLHDDYMTAKQHDRIITTLEPELAGPLQTPRQKSVRDWSVEVDELVQLTDGIKGGSAVQSSAFALLRASARLSQAAVHHPDELDTLWHLESQVRRALTKLQTTLGRAER